MSDDRVLVVMMLLGDSEAAHRLVLSWPLAPAGPLDDTQVLNGWGLVANVLLFEVQRWAPVLFGHGICRADRTVDPDALRAVKHLAAQRLRPPKGRRA